MPRAAMNGVIRPFLVTVRRTLADGTIKEYERYRANIDVTSLTSKRKTVTVTAKSYDECNEKVKKKLAEIRKNGGSSPTSSMKFGEYADNWLEHKRHNVDPKTYRGYRTSVKLHFKPLRNMKLNAILPTQVGKFIDNLQKLNKQGEEDGPAGVSLKRQTRAALSMIMKDAVNDGLILRNPVDAVKPPKKKDIEPTRSAFSVPEMREMLRVSSMWPDMRGVRMWWRLLTGQRQGEILGVYENDLHRFKNSDKMTMYQVNWKVEEIMRRHGCGLEPDDNGIWPCGYRQAAKCDKAQWDMPDDFLYKHLKNRWFLTCPKSQTGKRVPIIPELDAVVQMYQKYTKNWPNPYGLLFRNRDGSPIDPKTDLEEFNQLMRQCHINSVQHTGHETRNSVVTLLRANHVDPRVVELIVGHADRATDDGYFDVTDEILADAMTSMGDELDIKEVSWVGAA